MAGLDTAGFSRFLSRLGEDPDSAAERYEELRLKLTRFFSWKGTENYLADDLADETLDRVAAKVAEGIEIESLNAYTHTVARFVWLEHLRARKEEPSGDELPVVEVQPDEPEDEDIRLACLRSCLAEAVSADSDTTLVTRYYDPEPGEKFKEARKRLAEELGLTVNALKVRACRIRARLESCIGKCVGKKTKGM